MVVRGKALVNPIVGPGPGNGRRWRPVARLPGSGVVRRRLILWDVDGTLLLAGPVARTAFDAAVQAVLGGPVAEHEVQMGGKTDPQIALEILAAMAVGESEAREHLPGILRALERELEVAADRIRSEGRVLEGVREVLAELAARPWVAQTVLTGNLRANARLKLGALGLDRWLDLEIGAFGSDHHDRRELVPVALRQAERHRGWRLDPSEVWVVGDTPNDLACARAGGVRCLLVATGRTPREALEGIGADAVLPDLRDVGHVVRTLTGDPGEAEESPADSPPDPLRG